MSKKLSHTFVEDYIQKDGYKLLSEYVNSYTKMQIKCPKGHIYKVVWSHFKNGRRCPYCAGKMKKNTAEISKKVEKEGYLLFSEYEKNSIPMQMQCPQGHKITMTWANFQQGKRCRICSINKNAKKRTLSNVYIKNQLQQDGYKLMSNYKGANDELKIQCPQGHIYETIWARFQQGVRCSYCSGLKITTHFVKKELKKENYLLLSKYTDNASPLKIECPIGHKIEMSWGNFQKGHRCKFCFYERQKKDEKEVKSALEFEGYKLLSKYKNAYTKIELKCPKCHQYKVTWGNFKSGHRCPKCINKSEQKFREVMKEYFGAEFPIKKPKWLVNDAGNRLFLDGYNEELKIAFEYQGIQHFEKVSFFKDTEEKFKKRQKHDKIKKEKCKEMGIILLCPTYELEEEEYIEFIKKNI